MREFVLKTNSDPAAGRKLVKAVAGILSRNISNPEILHEIDLILTEACSNVCRHAYAPSQGDLEVRVRMDPPHRVELEISDWGRGISPADLCCTNPEPSAEGGRGLYIMSSLSDELKFESRGGRHKVSIVKNVGRDAWKTSNSDEKTRP